MIDLSMRPKSNLSGRGSALSSKSYNIGCPKEQSQVIASMFFKCQECNNNLFCIVCCLKFHQDHKSVVPYTGLQPQCHTRVECTEEEYTNDTYHWSYELDMYSTLKHIIFFEKELQRKANSFSKSFVRGSP